MNRSLPFWTWIVPLLVFHFGTGLSLNFQIARGISLWYFPVPLGMILIQWWGPRVLVGLYVNALLCAGFWGLYRWWLWPLYALPETLKVGLCWLLFTRLAGGKCWLPDFRSTWQFLILGIALPGAVASILGQSLLLALGDAVTAGFWQRAYSEFVLDTLSAFALSVPLLLFTTSWMEKIGLSHTQGAYPRPPLLLTRRITRSMWVEALIMFSGLALSGLALPLERNWFLPAGFLIWAALRFGIGLAAIASVWTIMLTLFLPTFLSNRFGETWMSGWDAAKMNLNLAILCFSAMVVGRALSDLYQEIETRIKGEQSLRQSEALLQQAQKLAKIGHLYNEPGKGIRIWSKTLLEIYGLDPEGPPPTREEHIRMLGADGNRLRMLEDIHEHTGEGIFEEYAIIRPDGGTRILQTASQWKKDGAGKPVALTATMKDITDRKRAESALVESEKKYRKLFDSASDAIVLSENGVIIECNRRCLEIFGGVREDFIGLPSLQLFAPVQPDGTESAVWIPAVRSKVLEGIPLITEAKARRRDGSLFDVESSLSKVTLGGRDVLFAVIRDVTERKAMQTATAEGESKYRSLFESATDTIFLAERGRILECNDLSLEMFRCGRDHLIGSPATRISPPLQPNGAESARLLEELREQALQGHSQRFEWRFLRKDGTTFDSETTLTSLVIGGKPHLIVVIRDISERKLVERALVESEERFRQMAENIQEIFFLFDRSTQTMLYVSPVAEAILGLPVSAIAARPLSINDHLHPEDRDRIGFFQAGTWFQRPINVDFRFLHPDGNLRWLRLRSFLIRDPEGEAYRVAGIVADITEYKNAQETARMHQQQLVQADKMNSLGMMVSGVAHEINNPNNLIMLNADVLETFWKHLRPVIREHAASAPDWKLAGLPYNSAEGKIEALLGGVAGGAKRIKRIVDNLKDFARMDAGDLGESIALDKVIEASVSIVDNLIRKSTDHFSVIHGENLPRIQGNFQKLEQVIINLITNACQALENRTKGIRIDTWYEPARGKVAIRVRDEGKGIPRELLGKVADPFFTTKRDTGGTGLGLSVSYGIIREHKGDMEFRSEPDQGTTIEIRIPAQAGRG